MSAALAARGSHRPRVRSLVHVPGTTPEPKPKHAWCHGSSTADVKDTVAGISSITTFDVAPVCPGDGKRACSPKAAAKDQPVEAKRKKEKRAPDEPALKSTTPGNAAKVKKEKGAPQQPVVSKPQEPGPSASLEHCASENVLASVPPAKQVAVTQPAKAILTTKPASSTAASQPAQQLPVNHPAKVTMRSLVPDFLLRLWDRRSSQDPPQASAEPSNSASNSMETEPPVLQEVPLNQVEHAVRNPLAVRNAIPIASKGCGGVKKKKQKQKQKEQLARVQSHPEAVAAALRESANAMKHQVEALRQQATASLDLTSSDDCGTSSCRNDGESAATPRTATAIHLDRLVSQLEQLDICISTLNEEGGKRKLSPAPVAVAAIPPVGINDAKGRHFVVFDTCALIKEPKLAKKLVSFIRRQRPQRPTEAVCLLVPLVSAHVFPGFNQQCSKQFKY